MRIREMSPSALQRVCPSWAQAQGAQSFLRTGFSREAYHVPGVRDWNLPGVCVKPQK
jgi:hypothetical protein